MGVALTVLALIALSGLVFDRDPPLPLTAAFVALTPVVLLIQAKYESGVRTRERTERARPASVPLCSSSTIDMSNGDANDSTMVMGRDMGPGTSEEGDSTPGPDEESEPDEDPGSENRQPLTPRTHPVTYPPSGCSLA